MLRCSLQYVKSISRFECIQNLKFQFEYGLIKRFFGIIYSKQSKLGKGINISFIGWFSEPFQHLHATNRLLCFDFIFYFVKSFIKSDFLVHYFWIWPEMWLFSTHRSTGFRVRWFSLLSHCDLNWNSACIYSRSYLLRVGS